VLATIAVVAGGCGDDAGDADREQIAAVLNQLFEAQENGDAATACTEVYVIQEPPRPGGGEVGEAEAEAEAEAEPAADPKAGGGEEGEAGVEECESAFEHVQERAQGQVRGVSTEVGSIEVDGDRATATVHTELRRADGSELSQDVPYDLVRTAGGWRVRISEEG
jgi:hypothetical protein